MNRWKSRCSGYWPDAERRGIGKKICVLEEGVTRFFE